MWLDNLKELKKKSGLTCAEIAERSNVAERTVKRIFSGESDHPYADTLDMIAKALDADLGAVFSDTSVVVATADIVGIKDKVDKVTAEADMLVAENNALKMENTALKTEVDLLRLKLEHKEENIALHNYYAHRGTREEK